VGIARQPAEDQILLENLTEYQLGWSNSVAPQPFKRRPAPRRLFLFYVKIPPENDQIEKDQPHNAHQEQLAQDRYCPCRPQPIPPCPENGFHAVLIAIFLKTIIQCAQPLNVKAEMKNGAKRSVFMSDGYLPHWQGRLPFLL
jgi:hypothetical protein